MLPALVEMVSFRAAEFARFSAYARSFSKQAGFQQEVADRVELVVEELALNVAHHGYQDHPGPLAMEIAVETAGIRIRLIDQAPPFDPTAFSLPDISYPDCEAPRCGFGIILIRKMSDSIIYRRDNGRNILEIFIQ